MQEDPGRFAGGQGMAVRDLQHASLMRLRLGRSTGAGSTGSVEAIVFATVIVSAGLATGNCSRELSSTAPTPAPAVVPAPPPAEQSVTLKGRVTEAAPTASTGIWDAVVTLSDGATSWSSAKTVGGEGRGLYEISGLHPGRYEAVASAHGYLNVTRDVTIAADTSTDFLLLPVPETKSHTFEDQISDTDGTCSDGIRSRPCRICAIPIHNEGPIEAILTWRAAGPVTLNVTLFQSGQLTPIARSTAVDATTERLTMNLPGGALYELRITYASGTGAAAYTMRVLYQN